MVAGLWIADLEKKFDVGDGTCTPALELITEF